MDGEEEGASKALLSDYSITPGTNLPQRTPRTPAQQDTVLQVPIRGTELLQSSEFFNESSSENLEY